MTQTIAGQNIQIIYQNVNNGELWDLAPVTQSLKWTTKRRGGAGSIELEILHDMPYPEGSVLQVKAGDKKLFHGYLFTIKKKKDGQRTLTFYDQKKYLQRSDTYVLKNKTLSEVVKTIANDFELETGELKGPPNKLPTQLKEDKNALDIIEECIDTSLVQTGDYCVFFDDFGKLRLDYAKNLRIQTVLADASIISDYEYESSIEESANQVKLVKNDTKQGVKYIYIHKDSNNIKRWGLLQHFQQVDENMNEAQIMEMSKKLIELKNRPMESVRLSFSMGDFDFRAGYSVFVELRDISMKGWYLLDSVTHTVTAGGHVMEIDLWNGDDQG